MLLTCSVLYAVKEEETGGTVSRGVENSENIKRLSRVYIISWKDKKYKVTKIEPDIICRERRAFNHPVLLLDILIRLAENDGHGPHRVRKC